MVLPREPTHTWLVASEPLQDKSGHYRDGAWRRVEYGGFLRIPAFPYVVESTNSSQAFYYFGSICFEACDHLRSLGHRIERLHLVLGGDDDLVAIYNGDSVRGFRFWAGMAVEIAE